MKMIRYHDFKYYKRIMVRVMMMTRMMMMMTMMITMMSAKQLESWAISYSIDIH